MIKTNKVEVPVPKYRVHFKYFLTWDCFDVGHFPKKFNVSEFNFP